MSRREAIDQLMMVMMIQYYYLSLIYNKRSKILLIKLCNRILEADDLFSQSAVQSSLCQGLCMQIYELTGDSVQ